MRVVALIPAYNEADRIRETLSSVAKIEVLEELVVIDDGSSDNTTAVVLETQKTISKKITLLILKQNQGKGGALNYGLSHVPADLYLLLDADLGSTASLAKELLEPVLHDESDMTIANFSTDQSLPGAKMGFGLVRRSACLGIRVLTGIKVKSPLSGQRAIKSVVLHTLGGFSAGFGVEVGLTVGALHHGFRIMEIPLALKHRSYGRGLHGFKHRGRQALEVIRALWQCYQKGWHL